MKIRAGLRLQLREVTLRSAQQHPNAVVCPRNYNRRRARLQPDDAAVAEAVGDGNGVVRAGGSGINRALKRGAEILGGAFVQSHVQLTEREIGYGFGC